MTFDELLDNQIERLLESLAKLEPEDPMFPVITENLADMCLMKSNHGKKSRWEKFVNNPPLVSVAGTFLGVLTVLYFEKAETIVSRSFGWLRFK